MRTSRMSFGSIVNKIAAALAVTALFAGLVQVNVLAAGETSGSRTSTTEAATKAGYDEVCALAEYLYNATAASPGFAFIGSDSKKFIWDTEGKKFTWTYYNGIMMDAFLMLDAAHYKSNVNLFYDTNVATDGKTVTYTKNGEVFNYYRETELDSIPPTRALFDLIDSRENSISPATAAQKTKYKKMINYVYNVMCNYGSGYTCGGVVPNTGGNFNHKIFTSSMNTSWANYRVALDGLYMAQPFFMEIANALENGNLTPDDFSGNVPSAGTLYGEVYSRMKWIGDNLYDPQTKLYNHGWGPSVGLNGHFWGRAVGWYAAALADVISMMPESSETYLGYRADLIAIEKQLFDGMIDWQDEATGLWYNVINRGSDLRGSKSQNQLETSGSALMAYAMLKSYCEGFVGDDYGKAGLRAFNGVCENYVRTEGTKVYLDNVYISSGVSTSDAGYLTKEYRTNEAKGVGPLIMAATYANEAAALVNRPVFKGHSLVLGSKIGINYYLTLPEGKTAAAYANSYVTFSGNEVDDTVKYYLADVTPDEAGRYIFTAYVTSVQMADEITAAFHYTDTLGTARTVEDTYSVLQYINYFDDYVEENPNQTVYSQATIDLVRAIADYGHYVQPMLAAENNWTIGADYAEMAKYYTNSYNYTAVTEAAAAYRKNIEKAGAILDTENIGMQLALDTDTVLSIFVRPVSGSDFTPSATFHGQEYAGTLQADGSYLIEIAGIPAAWLGDTVAVTDESDSFDMYVSALTYVYAAMNYDGLGENAEKMKNAVSALYYYYAATLNYRTGQ